MKTVIIALAVAFLLVLQTTAFGRKTDPDSVYLFSYATLKNNSHNGLHFAWSRDGDNWVSIGNEFSYLKSDYGRWGSEKKMFSPYLFLGADDLWHCIWSLNATDQVFAHASSSDLIEWGRQSYPAIKAGANFLEPVISRLASGSDYFISYRDKNHNYYRTITRDFKAYTAAVKMEPVEYANPTITREIAGGKQAGQIHRVSWELVENLIKTFEVKQYKQNLYGENPRQDGERFKDLKPVTATITLQPQKAKPISDLLLGVFFEDINYSADGGLYAELIQNRDFEYEPGDKEGRDRSWNSSHSWSLKGDGASFTIDSATPVHSNNPHYAAIKVQTPGATFANSGFDGIPVKKGQVYTFSIFTKQLAGTSNRLQVSLVDTTGNVLAQTILGVGSANWKKGTATLIPNADNAYAVLELKPVAAGSIGLDMVSLFPQNTFKARSNGLRADLAQTIADIHPRFVRFPGGCVAHGDGLGNIYRWKNTIGPLESRKPQRNLWGYHQSAGLGYFEYFQFCEDIGAAPVPVLAAGVPCQNSGTGGAGQQGGLPLDEMDEYIQDVLDLVEYANGDISTKWGKLRAAAGHPKPFNLMYVGIGNEDLITDVFEERFTMIYNAMRKTHPEITVIGTVGPFYEGTDYEQGWDLANKLKVPMVDEHYYEQPGWFIHNQNFYDSYDRNKSKVYLGEYASWGNSFYNALAEAAYLTALERNGDVVTMTSYAPLLAKEKHTQWSTDLIFFNNTDIKPTPNYYVQQLYGQHSGNEYLPSSISLSDSRDAVAKRVAVSAVRDTKNNWLVVKMVNLLPVAVRSSLDLKSLKLASTKGTKFLLQGNPADKIVTPVESSFEMNDGSAIELPAYSFTVLKFKLL
ncbi:MAG: alpha-L-arabinofuranosidase C-terminal domain-containing protein [Bacteroidota bacterium]